MALTDGPSEHKLTEREAHLAGENVPSLAATLGWRAFPVGSHRCIQPEVLLSELNGTMFLTAYCHSAANVYSCYID